MERMAEEKRKGKKTQREKEGRGGEKERATETDVREKAIK